MRSKSERAELAFPAAPEAFAAYQEAAAGRALSPEERRLVFGWLPMINLSYAEGQTGDKEALRNSLTFLDGLIETGSTPAVVRFLEGMRFWTVYAWKRGHVEGVAAV